MGKARNLNGLPGNLALSYLSTLYYYDGGYMGDWAYYLLKKDGLEKIVIDIINKSIQPKTAEVKSLLIFLDHQQEIINKEVTANGFKAGFIKKAQLVIQLGSEETENNPVVHCYPRLEDENGRIYATKNPITERVYPEELLKRIT